MKVNGLMIRDRLTNAQLLPFEYISKGKVKFLDFFDVCETILKNESRIVTTHLEIRAYDISCQDVSAHCNISDRRDSRCRPCTAGVEEGPLPRPHAQSRRERRGTGRACSLKAQNPLESNTSIHVQWVINIHLHNEKAFNNNDNHGI